MPTAGKLIGAALFAALVYYISTEFIPPLLPEGTRTQWIAPINCIFALIMGWRITGARAGEGIVSATGLGITTGVAIFFWCLLYWGGYEMIDRSTRLYYNGPFEALQDMANLMIEYARLAATPIVLGSMFLGSILAGWITDFFAQRWP